MPRKTKYKVYKFFEDYIIQINSNLTIQILPGNRVLTYKSKVGHIIEEHSQLIAEN